MRIDNSRGIHRVFDTYKTLTINGNGATLAGLFVVTGVVSIHLLEGVVVTAALAADLTACQLDIFPTAGAAVIMTKTAGAPAISSFEVGSLIGKYSDVAQILDVKRANVAMFQEAGVALQAIPFEFHVGKKSGAVTTIRFLYTAGADYAAETGAIKWHATWSAISSDGLLVSA